MNDVLVNPCPGYVFLRSVELNKTISGLEIPDEARGETLCGEVLACGDDVLVGESFVESPVKKGDSVFYRKYSEQEIDIKGDKFMLVKFSDIMGVLNG